MAGRAMGGGVGPRLLSIPARHPYVDAVRPVGVRRVRAGRPPWDQDPVFDPDVVAALAREADLVHLHFGFDHLDPDAARRWTAALAAAGLPLVLTVHDLRNPHHETRERHDDVLRVLIPAAAGLITLTAGAAKEIDRRFRRAALVLPHPTLLPSVRRTRLVQRETGLATLHLKSLRRNLQDPVAVVRAAADGARAAGGRLQVDLHPEVAGDPRLAGLPDLAGVEVSIHPRFSDLELEQYLRRAHVTVLPHRWGTHSGWLEVAHDLGTRVVAPNCGWYAEQWPFEVLSYGNNEFDGFDPASLADQVRTALWVDPPRHAYRPARLRQRERVRQAHADLYAGVTDTRMVHQ